MGVCCLYDFVVCMVLVFMWFGCLYGFVRGEERRGEERRFS